MLSRESSQSWDERAELAVDLSAAFKNCFFHAYAAHLLVNNSPLPDDLFTFDSILGVGSRASALQALFNRPESLALFEKYKKFITPTVIGMWPTALVEKTLILGHLLRENFATRLLQNQAHQEKTALGIAEKWIAYAECLIDAGSVDVSSDENGAQCAANLDFINYYAYRSTRQNDLTETEQKFERYFTAAHGDHKLAITNYWQAEGYKNYCCYLAQPEIYVSSSDISPVLMALNQPFIIYSNHGDIINLSTTPSAGTPLLEIMFNATNGHYYLLVNPATQNSLQEYKDNYHQYENDRTAVLSLQNYDIPEERREQQFVKETDAKSTLLLAAICPAAVKETNFEETLWDPFDLLLLKVKKMRNIVDDTPLKDVKDEDESTESNNYHFLLQIATALSALLSVIAFALTLAALCALISIPSTTIGAGALFTVGVFSGLASYGLFNTATASAPEHNHHGAHLTSFFEVFSVI